MIQCSHQHFRSLNKKCLSIYAKNNAGHYLCNLYVHLSPGTLVGVWLWEEHKTSICHCRSNGGIITSSKSPSSALSWLLIMTSDPTAGHASEEEVVEAHTDMDMFSTAGMSKFLTAWRARGNRVLCNYYFYFNQCLCQTHSQDRNWVDTISIWNSVSQWRTGLSAASMSVGGSVDSKWSLNSGGNGVSSWKRNVCIVIKVTFELHPKQRMLSKRTNHEIRGLEISPMSREREEAEGWINQGQRLSK